MYQELIMRLQIVILTSLIFTGCVTDYPMNVMDPPWVPEPPPEGIDENIVLPDQNTIAPLFFSEDDIPVMDGDFGEWQGLDGPLTRRAVFGGSHIPSDAEAFFVLRTDGNNLFIYSRVSDDLAHENFLPGSLAWRGDTVEIFFGVNTLPHTNYAQGDNQLRLVPRSREDSSDVDIVINQRTAGAYLARNDPQAIFGGAAVYSDTGYEIEVAIPLSLMGIDGLNIGQRVRCDFQVNDADETERDRMVHWISEGDDPWYDASVWGNGSVVALPETRKEAGNEL